MEKNLKGILTTGAKMDKGSVVCVVAPYLYSPLIYPSPNQTLFHLQFRNEKPLLAMKMESPPQGRYKNAKYQNTKRLNFNYLLTIKLKQNLTVYKTNLLRDN